MILQICLLVLAAYVVGATPFGFLMGKLHGIDVRDHGSGNIGATNVLRTVGKRQGIFVFGLDVLKGLVPVLVGRGMAASILADQPSGWLSFVCVLIAFAAILGHNFTFWLGFKGGKGVATSGGALIALMPWAVLASALVWAAVFFSSRYVSLASISAAATLPLALLVQGFIHGHHGLALLILALLVAGLGIWRHRANIARLLAGTENRIAKPSEKVEGTPSS